MDNFHQSINSITKELRKDSLSVKNRLQSILHDAKFVESIQQRWDFPLIPNERCGLWYVPTWKQNDSTYFKSTDGHTNVWTLSMRRLNLHLLPIISEYGGIVVVDSTRKGKLMPDALSKTIPIWCAVLNTILYQGASEEDIAKDLKISNYEDNDEFTFLMKVRANNWLYTPKGVIPESEDYQISILIQDLAATAVKLNVISKEKLIGDLGKRKPLIPEWHYPLTKSKKAEDPFEFGSNPEDQVYYSIKCLTSSKKTVGQENSQITLRYPDKIVSWTYVQGSADDHELWATNNICKGKFDSKFFWNYVYFNNNELNEHIIDKETGYIHDWMSDEDLIKEINVLYESKNLSTSFSTTIHLDVSDVKNSTFDTKISFGLIDQNLDYESFLTAFPGSKQVIILSEAFSFQKIERNKMLRIFQYKVESNKKGAKKLREIFPKLVPELNLNEKILILCDSGKDLSAGLVLLLLCKYYNLSWELDVNNKVNKDLVKSQLSLLCEIRKVNPSRNTLQSVNSYLM